METKTILCGTTQAVGSYSCCNCGTTIELEMMAVLPHCPACGNDTFTQTE